MYARTLELMVGRVVFNYRSCFQLTYMYGRTLGGGVMDRALVVGGVETDYRCCFLLTCMYARTLELIVH